jgi:hypothetical protein
VKSKVTYTCYIEIDDIKTLNEICDRIREYTSNIDLIPAKSGIANHVGVEFKADSIAQYDSIINIIEQSESVAVVFPLQS